MNQPVDLYPLAYLTDGDRVTLGRTETDSYAEFPEDGAALVRQLASGMTPRDAANWYFSTYGEHVDIVDILGALDELGFVRTDAQPTAPPARPVRWQRLGRALFSPSAWCCYGLLTAGWISVMIHFPWLAPHYQNLFFTDSYTVVELVLFVGQLPLLLVHEGFHALAGRRLGLRSRLSIGRRMYFIVFETALDGLVVVPRRQRIVPILAGMLADVLVMAMLTLTAALTLRSDGTPSALGRLCLAMAYSTLLRLIWQFYFYLRTDLYVLFTTALGCVDLHTVAMGVLRNAFRRLAGRPGLDGSAWHPVDRRVARWYAWLMLTGYVVTSLTFVIAIAPITYRFFSGVISRFFARNTPFNGLLDSAIVIALNMAEIVVIISLTVRDRRRRQHATELQHVAG
jgi:hypothetical protein